MRFKAFLALSHINQLKLGLFCTQRYLAYTIVLNWLVLKIIVICSKLRVKLRFYAFLCFFGTFAHKAAKTWCVFHETWHTTLFGINYFVEVLRIENHSHMLEITYYVPILCVFKLSRYFRA